MWVPGLELKGSGKEFESPPSVRPAFAKNINVPFHNPLLPFHTSPGEDPERCWWAGLKIKKNFWIFVMLSEAYSWGFLNNPGSKGAEGMGLPRKTPLHGLFNNTAERVSSIPPQMKTRRFSSSTV